ncbi:DUF5615 family PIN-like protein [Phenylobacterium terrae]|uniref:DUF5615 family PIN-like protein n=1 Tax=Phenylobacterium terrae TaxID=2665495 RepID=A0ABW4MX99_9CAUL
MRFLCDEMLVRLARLLRAAGYDTVLAEGGASDRALRDLAREEGRILVTRDRDLARLTAPGSVLITAPGVEAEARTLSAALPIDWSLAPFSRCVMDNTVLRDATADEIAQMPTESQAMAGPFRACPSCGRLYWPGSHVKRIAERLERLAGVERSGGSD